MPLMFPCKCGKKLQAKEELADKRVKCPACGRVVVVPRPASLEGPTATDWEIDATPQAAERAERAGVIVKGRAGVIRLHSASALEHDLPVKGEVVCRHCQAVFPFAGGVFGRPGLGGTLANLACPKCRARVWIGWSSHLVEDGAEVFVYAPSQTRDFAMRDDERKTGELRSPQLTIATPPVPATNPAATRAQADDVLARFTDAIRKGQMYQEVSDLARELVLLRLSFAEIERVRVAHRELLEKETRTHLAVILAEALACLRDDEAGPIIHAVLRRALDNDDVKDRGNVPLHDLCLLALIFDNEAGFLDAAQRGLPRTSEPTRAYQLGKQVTLKTAIENVKDGERIDALETSLGGENWQFIYAIRDVPTAAALVRKPDSGSGLFKRLFGSLRKPGASSTPLPENKSNGGAGADLSKVFAEALINRFADNRIDAHWLPIKDDRGARYDFQRLVAEAKKGWSGHGVLVVRGHLIDTMDTKPFVGIVCRTAESTATWKWLKECSCELWNAAAKKIGSVSDQTPDNFRFPDAMHAIREYQWVG